MSLWIFPKSSGSPPFPMPGPPCTYILYAPAPIFLCKSFFCDTQFSPRIDLYQPVMVKVLKPTKFKLLFQLKIQKYLYLKPRHAFIMTHGWLILLDFANMGFHIFRTIFHVLKIEKKAYRD